MVISSSNVSMASQRSYHRNVKGQTTTTRWQLANPSTISTTTQTFSRSHDEESVYNNYNYFARNPQTIRSDSTGDYGNVSSSISGVQHPSELGFLEESMSKTLRSLLDMLYKARGLTRNNSNDYNYLNDNTVQNVFLNQTQTGLGTIWNQITDTSYTMEESETTSFSSTGTAITADGRTLEFNVSFTMSRAFKEEYHSSAFTQYEQVLTDPLVINLDSSPVSVSDQTFFFDIDCDGKEDEISSLGAGNGFLAYDKNNDGIINDGSELFGTRSGNGFYDLSQYDEDGNGWIDEADAIFEHLKIWTKDEDGNDRLISLKDADVGAIYLGNTRTPFSMTDPNNNLDAVIRSTGIFLRESGGSGTISQIDLAKHQEV
ncbi:MAG: hypothetical protein PUF12_12200 [Thermoflexaceae bacterium]|nr:hypothetical protein [Thermoflexaceae bacterium]